MQLTVAGDDIPSGWGMDAWGFEQGPGRHTAVSTTAIGNKYPSYFLTLQTLLNYHSLAFMHTTIKEEK